MKLARDENEIGRMSPEASIQAFFKLSPDLLCIRNPEGYFQELNALWTETFGWSPEELKSRPWMEFIHPNDFPFTDEIESQCRTAPHNSTPFLYKNRFCAKDGSYRWLSWRVTPYEGGLSYGIARDVTANHWQGSGEYRTAVQEAVKLRDQAIAASSVGIVIADAQLPDMPLIYVNPAFEKISGYSAAEVLGYNCRFLQGEKTEQAELQKLRTAIKNGTHCTVKLLNYRKDGTPFWNELTISPIYDQKDRLTHFVGIQSDVSDRVRAEKALRVEKRKSEKLLLNVLPKSIVEQLKRVEGSLAKQFDAATILFADIAGFTPLSAQLQPLEVITFLNQVFSCFDRLVEKYNLEKIKTIGDAYMVAGGLPVPRGDHADAIAQIALEMQESIAPLQKETQRDFKIRIGINTGAVVAGVIGQKKFIYDLWGDAVNVASRMEALGEPGKIQVSQETYEQLKDKFYLEKRGAIAVKGKGEMTTYWLLGKKE